MDRFFTGFIILLITFFIIGVIGIIIAEIGYISVLIIIGFLISSYLVGWLFERVSK